MSEILPTVNVPLVPGSQPPEPPPAEDELGRDTFLRLLTTQMQNQDPSNPLSNEEFVAQLAQFSSLEAMLGLQETMEAVYLGIASMNNTSMAALLGKEVVAVANEFKYSGEGDVTLRFDASGSYSEGTVTVFNEDGDVVATEALGGGEAGEGTFVWDGTDLNGQPLPEGTYSFEISASDQSGASVTVESLVRGTITEMDYSSGTPQPSLDGVVIGLDSILRLTTPDEEV